MRHLLTWFLLLGLLAGVRGNVLASDPCDVLVSMHAKEHAGHQHDPAQPCDPSHDQKCPLEHHQHCACSHTMPVGNVENTHSRLAVPAFSLMPVRSECQLPPDGPCSELDKPPLI